MWGRTGKTIVAVSLILLSHIATAGHAVSSDGQVLLPLPDGSSAIAEYRPGERDKPTLIIVHPFLQTGGFSTIHQLADEMSDAGYPVLLPTLTLGVSARDRPLPCEAIHTDSLADTATEISAWVGWLEKGGKDRLPVKSVILIGHSSGTLSIAEYVRSPASSVKKSILISLPYFYDDEGKTIDRQQLKKAREMLARGDKNLGKFALAYCNEYVATPEAFLSYAELDRQGVIKLLRQARTQVKIILGSADVRLSPDWAAQLQKQGFDVTVIEGGTHFFNKGHEFDLVEAVESALEL